MKCAKNYSRNLVPTMSNKTVADVMIKLGNFPVVPEGAVLKKALDQMTLYKLGVACIVDSKGLLVGIVTDGDLRRILLGKQSPLPALLVTDALEFSSPQPKTVTASDSIAHCIDVMRVSRISDIPVVGPKQELLGIVHFHSII
jgi:CBS domain-containing protein